MGTPVGKTAVLSALALLLLPLSTARAQHDFSVQYHGGITVPVSDLSDLTDPGPGLGAEVFYRVNGWMTVWGGAQWDQLQGADFTALNRRVERAPDVDLYRYRGGIGLSIPVLRSLPVDVSGHLGWGLVILHTDRFGGPIRNPVTNEFKGSFAETYPTAEGGLRLTLDLASRVTFFVDGTYGLVFADEDDTVLFSNMSGGDVEAFDLAHSIPLSGGFRLTL